MSAPTAILLVSGSLRGGSSNSALLRTAAALSVPGILTVFYRGMGELPHFNPDYDVPGEPLHPGVRDLRAQLAASDAVLFSTPEYAGALPGSFKNLLDWLIGDGLPRSIYEKPVAWINASPRGAPNAHAELRTVLGFAHATIVDAACVHVPITETMIGPDGLIADTAARDELAEMFFQLLGDD